MKISDLVIVVFFVCFLLGFTCLPSKAQTIPTSSIIDVKEDDRVATIYWNSKTQLYDYKYDPDKVNKELNLSPWDVAGGAYIVQQAGGIVTDFHAKNQFVFGNSILASNVILHQKILSIIQQKFS